jgi:hypothetical protein
MTVYLSCVCEDTSTTAMQNILLTEFCLYITRVSGFHNEADDVISFLSKHQSRERPTQNWQSGMNCDGHLHYEIYRLILGRNWLYGLFGPQRVPVPPIYLCMYLFIHSFIHSFIYLLFKVYLLFMHPYEPLLEVLPESPGRYVYKSLEKIKLFSFHFHQFIRSQIISTSNRPRDNDFL